MADKAWKAWERTVAKIFGGKRRGAYTGDGKEGKSDIVHPHYSIECKLLSRSGHAHILDACHQSEDNADSALHEPIAIVKRKGDAPNDALVCMRLETFREWRLSPGESEDG